jgi:hypothetical protein
MMEATPRPGLTYPVYLDWVGTTCRIFNADGASDIVVADRETGEIVVNALNSNANLATALTRLLALVEHDTGLPDSAANGVTDSTGSVDEGIARAADIIYEARKAAGLL